MGPRAALVGSWGIVGGYVTVAMFQSVAVPRAAGYLFPGLNQFSVWSVAGSEVYLPWIVIGVVTSILLTVMNIRGIRYASLFQTSVMTFLVVVAVVLAASAVFGGQPANLEPLVTGGSGGVIAVLLVVPFLFLGFDVIPQSAEEAKVPPRQIGKLIVISVIMATLFYIVIVLATAYAAPRDEVVVFDLDTADALAYMLGHPFWGQLVVAGGLAGIVTTWNAFLIGASRLLWALANSGMIPAWFGRMHPKNGTPVNALLFVGGITTLSPFFGVAMLGWAVDSGGPSIIFTYLMVALAFLVLRRKEPGMDRPMRIGRPGGALGPIVGAAAVLSTAAMLSLYLPGMPAFLDVEPWLIFLVWWAIGIWFAVRIPGGVKAGPDAEHDLLAKLAERRRRRTKA
ncbi:APC family permease [Microbacterium sp. 18062]|uniref:APC family permease n=1 Tax=Microbacterium sp. 18062 TaxID=2681410 RepID=UPI00190F92D3|nr:APC family permease [Microbacterium sp. 18062]